MMNPPPRQIRDRQQRACQLPGWHPGKSGAFSVLARILLLGFGGQAALGMGDPYSFQSIAAVVIGGAYILGSRGHYVGTVAGSISLVALVSLPRRWRYPSMGAASSMA
jgi:ribose transport system permease protein